MRTPPPYPQMWIICRFFLNPSLNHNWNIFSLFFFWNIIEISNQLLFSGSKLSNFVFFRGLKRLKKMRSVTMFFFLFDILAPFFGISEKGHKDKSVSQLALRRSMWYTNWNNHFFRINMYAETKRLKLIQLSVIYFGLYKSLVQFYLNMQYLPNVLHSFSVG